MHDLRQTAEYADYMERIGWMVEERQGIFAYIKKVRFTPISLMKIQRVEVDRLDFGWIDTLRARQRVLVSYIEPSLSGKAKFDKAGLKVLMEEGGFKISSNSFCPTKTLIINLKHSPQVLIKKMHYKTRYNLKQARKQEMLAKVVLGDELLNDEALMREVYRLLIENATRNHYWKLPFDWFVAQLKAFADKAMIVLFFSRNDKALMAATVYLTSQDTIFYQHNGSTALGRRLKAPTLAVWTGMEQGRQKGKQWYDFDGIFDERYPFDRWRGFTRFKRSFGGEERFFSTAWQKWGFW
jgi:lipid II:glycine glycyltransferase (peptidoglycan interpeptide bridge formation enzyme)